MIGIEIRDGADALARLAEFPARMNARLGTVMEMLGDRLLDRVRDKLGGQVLQQRSGRLAAALDAAIDNTADGAGVSVGVTDVPYAAFQEYGFHGTETVRAHLRTIREAFGRPIAPRAIAVGTHSRRVDYPAHSYLRSALDDIAPDAVTAIGQAASDGGAT